MIKTLGPLEDASDLASIAPVLHQWSDVVSKAEKQVRPRFERGCWGMGLAGEWGLKAWGWGWVLSIQIFLSLGHREASIAVVSRPVC